MENVGEKNKFNENKNMRCTSVFYEKESSKILPSMVRDVVIITV
jgi:hypothetical protein